MNEDLGSLWNLKLSTLTGSVKHLFPFSISAALTGQNTKTIINTQHIILFPVTSAATWTKYGHHNEGDNVFSHTVTTNLPYYIVQKHQNNHHFNYIHHHNPKILMFLSSYIKKCKVHPRTSHEDPEGEWRYSSTLSLTLALEGAGGQCHARLLYPLEVTWQPLYRRLGGPQSWSGQVQKILPPTGIQSPDHPACSK